MRECVSRAGSGKTHTMQGTPDDPGIALRYRFSRMFVGERNRLGYGIALMNSLFCRVKEIDSRNMFATVNLCNLKGSLGFFRWLEIVQELILV